MSKKNMKKKKWKKVFGAWLAIVIVLVAILAVLVYKNANRKVLYDYGFRRKPDRS